MFAPPPYASPTSRSRDRGHSSSSSTSSNSYMSTPTPSSAMSYSSSSSLSLPVSPDGTDALTASMSSSSISSTSTASSNCSACCHSERGICPQHKLIQLSLKGIDSSGPRPRNLSQPLPMTGSSRTLSAVGTGAASKERRSSLTNRDMEFISATRTCTPRAPFIKPLNTNLQRATSVPATAPSKSASNFTSNMQHSNPNPSSTNMTMSPISASSLLSTRSLQRSLTDNPNPSHTLPSSTYSPSTFLSPLPTLSQYATFQPPSSSSSTSSSSGSSPIPAPRHNLWGLSLSLSPNPPPRFSTISDSYAPTTASSAFPTFSPLMPNNNSRDFNNKRVADCLEESAPSSPWISHDQNAKKRHVYVSPGFNPRHMQAQMMTSNTAATGSATSSAYASLATSPYSIHVSPFGHTPLTSSGYASGASSPSTTYATPIPISPFLPTYPLSSTNRHARRRSSNPFEFPPGSLGSGSGSGPNSANSSPSTSRRNSLLPPPPMYGSASGPGSGHALEVNATLTMPSTMPIANMSYDTNMAEQPTLTFTPSPLPLNVLATTATSTPVSSSASNSASVTPSITPVPAATSAPPSSFSSSMGYYPPVSASVSDSAPATGSASTCSSSVESATASPNADADADEEAISDADLTEELAELHQQLSLQAEQARRQLQDVEFRMQVTAASIDTIHAMMMAKQRTPNTPATPITPNNTAATTPTNIYMHGSGPTTPSHSMTPMQLPLQMPPHMQQMPAMGLMRSQSVPYSSHSHGYAPAHGHGQGQGHGYGHGPYTMSMTPAPYSPMDQHMTTTTSTMNPQHTYQ